MRPIIYLDNSATTRVRDEVLESMIPFQSEWWGNASSTHRIGRQSRSAINQAREQVADAIGASPEEIFFTPSATYSNNAAILGRARYVEDNGLGRHIITTGIEHSSALGPAKYLESRGWKLTILSVNKQGFIDLNELKKAITPDTSIISVMWANNEIGTLQPVEEIAAIAKAAGVFFHTDAVQVAGKLAIDVSALGVDTLALSGHKFYAPKGIGILYIREGVEILPLVFGGGQECGLFPGTEGLANIVAIGRAAELCSIELESNQAHLRKMQQLLINKLLSNPRVKLTGPSDLSKRLPGHVSVIVEGTVGADVAEHCDMKGVYISSVSACSSSDREPSHVLKALGYFDNQAIGSLRISAGVFNTEQDCQKAAEILGGVIDGPAALRANFAPLMAAG